MELIEALEQLSLHVRSSKKSNPDVCMNGLKVNDGKSISSHGTSWTSEPHSSHATGSINQADHNYEYLMTDGLNRIQLQEFDTSIETLFSQLLDLDDKPQPSINLDHPRHSRPPRLIDTRLSYHLNGSIETSQEEDSDNSSQRSGHIIRPKNSTSERWATDNCNDGQHMNPFVSHLLQRDLSAITDTVRKLGMILSIGGKIESIYRSVSEEQDYDIIDPLYCRSLCSKFVDLCSSEPCICDLPTIIRYNDYCHLLLTLLDKFTNTKIHPYTTISSNNIYVPSTSHQEAINSSSSQYSNNHSLSQYIDRSNDQYIKDIQALGNSTSAESLNQVSNQSESNEINLMCLDDALDCALLECDQRQLDNIDSSWTNNKLYTSNG